jgi:predicted site-specific integrase-resolvase
MGWLKIKRAAAYAGVSERTCRTWLKEGLRHARLPSGCVLIKEMWLDEYLEQFESSKNEVDNLVDQVWKEMR